MPTLESSPAAATAALADLVADLLAGASLYVPPVDALAVADSLGMEVVYDSEQSGRARIKRLGDTAVILLKPDDRMERQQWAVAHEIGEALSHRGLALDDCANRESAGRRPLRESFANEFASRLLLPDKWFLADAERLDGDLVELKSIYRTASHELILTNLLRLPILSLVTVFDHGRVTRRRGNGQLAPPPLLPVEREVVQQVRASGEPYEASDETVRVQGWAVHEPGWPRELLRCTPLDLAVLD